MTVNEQVSYRLKLAQGFLSEARQDVDLKRWRSAMDNAQLSVENATKAALALLGPVGAYAQSRCAITAGAQPIRLQR